MKREESKQGLAPESLDVVEVEPGAYSVIRNGRSFSIVFDGSDFVIDGVRTAIPPDPRDWRGGGSEVAAGGSQRITAPMPGRVVSILVSVGDTVEAGSGVVVVEAMKMQNELKSARAGTVVSIHVKEGATVGGGEVLATIE